MFDLLIIGYLSYRNGMRAKTKGLSAMKWGLLSFAATFCALFFGMYFVIVVLCRDSINLAGYTTFSYKESMDLANKVNQVFTDYPLRMVLYELIGFGGYLFIRYMLDRKPDKKEPEMNWMDTLENKSGGE